MRIILVRAVCMVMFVAAFSGFNCGPIIAKAEQNVSTRKTLNFSGYVWKVKSSEKRVGPGSNYFSDSNDNVWVDNTGRLHLKFTEREGRWYCAEVISEKSFGLGTYHFYLSTPLAKLDSNITLGLFTWSDAPAYAHREIDIECAKWGKANDTNNAQFVVQPYQPRGRLLRYRVPENIEAVTYSFFWQTNSVLFRCVEGHVAAPATGNTIIQEWNFTKSPIPKPGDENRA